MKMPRVSRQYLYDFSVEDVQAVATKTGTTAQHVNKIIAGGKTNSQKIAAEVSALTGKPVSLYLVQKGVKIDLIQGCPSFPETYEMTKEPNPDSLALLSDVELLQFAHTVRMQWVEVASEMHRRMTCATT
jgi:hypothetical protein